MYSFYVSALLFCVPHTHYITPPDCGIFRVSQLSISRGTHKNYKIQNSTKKNDFGLKAEKNMFVGRSLQGDIGSGDVSISIESVNGSVKILKN